MSESPIQTTIRSRPDRHRPRCSRALIGWQNPRQAVRRPAQLLPPSAYPLFLLHDVPARVTLDLLIEAAKNPPSRQDAPSLHQASTRLRPRPQKTPNRQDTPLHPSAQDRKNPQPPRRTLPTPPPAQDREESPSRQDAPLPRPASTPLCLPEERENPPAPPGFAGIPPPPPPPASDSHRGAKTLPPASWCPSGVKSHDDRRPLRSLAAVFVLSAAFSISNFRAFV